MKNFITLMCFLLALCGTVKADERHEFDKMRVKFESNQFSKSNKIKETSATKRDYIQGESSAYALSKNKVLTRLTAPYVHYPIRTEMPGGTYEVTIAYRAKKDSKYSTKPEILVSFDEFDSEKVSLDFTNTIKRKKVDFKTNLLKGKKHTIKKIGRAHV